MNDIRIAFRQLRKSPGFALTVILTIALGIGANTAIFTLVHAVLMKSLPVVDPKTLYRVGDKDDCCVNGGFIERRRRFRSLLVRVISPPSRQHARVRAAGGDAVGPEHDDGAARLRARQGRTHRICVRKLFLDLRNRAIRRTHADARPTIRRALLPQRS